MGWSPDLVALPSRACSADQLGVIFVSRLVVGNFMEVVMPVIKGRCARKIKGLRQRMEDGGDQASNSDEVDVGPFAQAERESSLEEYDSFDDWAETLIQFGYVSLFVVAFPLAPLLAFVNNYAELRVDAYKATTATRADPDGAQDVGTWFRWLTVMGYACVITNVATLCFSATSNAFAVDFATREKVWTFLILEVGALCPGGSGKCARGCSPCVFATSACYFRYQVCHCMGGSRRPGGCHLAA